MTVAEAFETLQSLFNPAAAAGLNKTLQWNVSGEQAGQWALHIKDQKCEVIPGGVAKPDITFQLSDQDLLAIAEQKLHAMTAVTQGKVKIAGDMMLAMRMPQLFSVKNPRMNDGGLRNG